MLERKLNYCVDDTGGNIIGQPAGPALVCGPKWFIGTTFGLG